VSGTPEQTQCKYIVIHQLLFCTLIVNVCYGYRKLYLEMFEDTKRVIRYRISKERQYGNTNNDE
jgi:hypothetical protein